MRTQLPASPKQRAFILRLANEKDTSKLDGMAWETMFDAQYVGADGDIKWISMTEASNCIDALLACPNKSKPGAVTEPGFYKGADGIYQVKRSRQSYNLYAMRLEYGPVRRLNENNEVVDFKFVYTPGAIRGLSANDKLSKEDAAEVGIKTGVCVYCSKRLDDAVSVERGIGPVCYKRYHGA